MLLNQFREGIREDAHVQEWTFRLNNQSKPKQNTACTVATLVAELGGCVPDRAGIGGFVAGAEPLRVDNCGGSVLL